MSDLFVEHRHFKSQEKIQFYCNTIMQIKGINFFETQCMYVCRCRRR